MASTAAAPTIVAIAIFALGLWQTFDRDPATNRLTRSTVKRQSSTAAYDLENQVRLHRRRLDQVDPHQRRRQTVRPAMLHLRLRPTPATDKTRTYSYPAPLGDSGIDSPHALKSLTETDGDNSRTDLYTYDQIGNTTARPGQKLVWDAEGNLSKITDDTGKELAGFIYDAAGNRLIRKDTNGTTLYLASQEVKVSAGGTVSAVRYYSHAGQTVAYRTGTSSSTIQFLVPDYQGSADTTVNAVDQDTWSLRQFAPFGTERSSPLGVWPAVMDKGYVGGTKDTTTGLTHLGAREYDPVTGRFLSADPVTGGGDPITANGYSYSGNNPVDHADPTGQYRDGGFNPGGSSYGNPGISDRHDLSHQHRNAFKKGGGGGIYIPPPPAPGGGGCWVGCNGSVGGDPVPVKKHCGWSCKVGKVGGFIKKHQATIAGIAAGAACEIASGGTATIACAAVGGWVYGAVSYHQNTPSDQQTLAGGFKAALTGAAIDAALAATGMLAARAAAPFLGRVAPKLIPKFKPKGGPPGRGNPVAKARPAAAKTAGKAANDTPVAGGGGKAGCNSFVPSAAVLMANGTSKAIDKIKVGDKVLATDPTTGTTTAQPVLATITGTGTKRLVQLTIDTDGQRGNKSGVLIATDGHPFWVPAAGKWIDAAKLQPGTWLRTSSGTHVQITAIKTWTQRQRVHNLTVAGAHTYYVNAGDASALVHNCGLTNNRSEAIQQIELKAAADRGVSPVTLSEGAGMSGLGEAIGGASDFKWAVTMDNELKVIPAQAGGGAGEWPEMELAHTVLAGLNGKLRAAGSGTFMEGFPAFINRWSGHFEPGVETLGIGEDAFRRAGIDFISSPLIG